MDGRVDKRTDFSYGDKLPKRRFASEHRDVGQLVSQSETERLETSVKSMFAGYTWLSSGGGYGSYTLRWEPPRSTVAEHSIYSIRVRAGEVVSALAWVRSVTVRDPSTGQETVVPNSSSAPVQIADNVVAVTYSLSVGGSADNDVTGLVNAFWWS